MSAKFKCCRKDLNNFCCVFCHSILHKSCCDRKKDVTMIQDHKIYCSKICEEMSYEVESYNSDLHSVINKLKDEIEEKNKFIHKVKRNTKAFEDDVLETERSFIEEIDEKKKTIINLNNKVSQLIKEKIEKERNQTEEDENQKIYEKNIMEMEMIIEKMRKKIASLDNKNKIISEELDLLRGQINKSNKIEKNKDDADLKLNNIMDTIYKQNAVPLNNQNQGNEKTNEETNIIKEQKSHMVNNKPKILIMADNNGKNCVNIFKNMYGSLVEVSCFYKPNALIEDVVTDCAKLTKTYNKNDHIIILAGVNNIIRGRNMKTAFLNNLLAGLNYTNVIIMGVPYVHRRDILNKLCYNFNTLIFTEACKFDNVKYIDPNIIFQWENYINKKLELTYGAKQKLFRNVNFLNSEYKENTGTSNLTKVKIMEETDETYRNFITNSNNGNIMSPHQQNLESDSRSASVLNNLPEESVLSTQSINDSASSSGHDFLYIHACLN